jgi:chemotaxis signal transduction protein
MLEDTKVPPSDRASSSPRRRVLSGYFDDLLKSPEESDLPFAESNDPEFSPQFKSNMISDTALCEGEGAADTPMLCPDAVNQEQFHEQASESIEELALACAQVSLSESEDHVDQDASVSTTQWDTHRFDALLVELDHASLIIPLLLIGNVCKCDHNLVHIAGQPPWFLGIYTHNGQNIKVLDTQFLVTNKSSQIESNLKPQYILTIPNSAYGFSCRGVQKVVKLKKEDVSWRAEKRDKKWYRGIVTKHMCVLLDIQQLLEERVH